jgi:ADP-ribose pyrophosphatase YjhB (NUDIX family)
MPKPRPKIARTRPTKEVSVMAWIEDAEQRVLLVRQAVGLRLWTLPGGKVKRGESLVKAIRRELYEETGLRVEIGSLLGVLDRRDKDAITLLFAAVPNNSSIKVKQNNREIERADFQASLPKKASPSAKYFWSARSMSTVGNSAGRSSKSRSLVSAVTTEQPVASRFFNCRSRG